MTNVSVFWKALTNNRRPDVFNYPINKGACESSKEVGRDLHKFLEAQSKNADRASLNKRLRKICSEYFLRADFDTRTKLAKWVVRNWGGIYALEESTIESWLQSLSPFAPPSIEAFVSSQRTDRISSWSKILAFHDPENHAIYDSRTSTALNVALYASGGSAFFHMPKGRNTAIDPARTMLKKRTVPTLGYSEYIQLLRDIVAEGHSPTILDAEMTIFANAPRVCRAFTESQA